MKSGFFPLLVAALMLAGPRVHAGFHVMQVEEIIGGINGNTSAQAIQLRLRGGGQNIVSAASLWASDATGSNRILLLNIASNVTNAAAGATVLLTTSAFNSTMIAGGAATFTPDFVLANAIPASYLSAGRITYEADGGTVATPGFIYWSLAWGGAGYTGSNTNSDSTNGATGGTPFGSALPTSTRQGVIFSGLASAPSTSNSTDYGLTAIPATVTRNNGSAFTVVPEPGLAALFGFGALSLGGLCWRRRRA